MLRLAPQLVLLVALAPGVHAQTTADRELVRRIYADLERGDALAVRAVLDEHVVWVEGGQRLPAGRYVGAGTVADGVLRGRPVSQSARPHAVTADTGRVVVTGLFHRVDAETGHLVAAPFRDVWRVLDGRVVSVDRSDEGADLAVPDLCGYESC